MRNCLTCEYQPDWVDDDGIGQGYCKKMWMNPIMEFKHMVWLWEGATCYTTPDHSEITDCPAWTPKED